MTDDLPPLRDVIARYGLAARKSLGQNFLLDMNLTGRIARAAGDLSQYTVIEVGPGPGGLTRALLACGAKRVVAIEQDQRALPALQDICDHYHGRLEVIHGDALRTDASQLVDGPAKVVANLPYNIATPLLTGWLTAEPWPPWFSSLTLLFQKEVAVRIAAQPGSGAYGRLSVLSQWRSSAARLFDIDRRAFTPAPKVTSSLVQIVPDCEPNTSCDSALLQRVTAAAFGQRRKMLRSSLKPLCDEPHKLLECAGISDELRAERLSIDDFCRLARCLEDI